jgi:ribosome-associated heat shock protein Hsp15
MIMQEQTSTDGLRIDKWLWAARFFKTRALASAAVKGGKIEVNGDKAKPAKLVRSNDMLKIQRGMFEYSIKVLGVTTQRGPATIANLLYEELPDSIERREALAQELKNQAMHAPLFTGRPSKLERRRIVQFTRKRS